MGNANLMLNIQMAQSEVTSTESKTSVTRKTSETTKMSVKKERRRSVILQCAVSGQSDVDIVWKKEGAILETTEQKKTSRYSVEKKASTQNQTIIQLKSWMPTLRTRASMNLWPRIMKAKRNRKLL